MVEPKTTSSQPDLSVVVVTPTTLQRLERTLRALQAQTIRERLEIILVAPSTAAVEQDPHELLVGFENVQIVPIGDIGDVTMAGASGVPHCRTDIVAFVEDHAYPVPLWADSIVRSHQGPWAAVGSTLTTANPESIWGWASQFLSYGPFTAPVAGGEIESLPAHNVTYKKELLLDLDQPLASLLHGWGGDLNIALSHLGHKLYLDSVAIVDHQNTIVVKELLSMNYISGRYYAGRRWQSEGWSLGRRALYSLGSPLIPFKRAVQLWQEAFQGKDRSAILPAVWFAIAPLLVVDAIGQLVGFLFGEGDAAAQMARHELVDRLTIS